jgi:hypothetical protein
MALAPEDAAVDFQAHGVVLTFLTLAAVFGGTLQWAAEGRPGRLPRSLGMARAPVFVVLILFAVLVSSLDGQLGYHTPRTLDKKPNKPVTVHQAFKQWREAAIACRNRAGGTTNELPLLLVAAPGGGARAAYWTATAMRGLARLDKCAGGSVFAATGVSGGSVGLAVWAASGDDAQTDVEALTSPHALAADVAGMLFRDLPRTFLGIHPWGVDRAAVEENVWMQTVPELRVDFSRIGGRNHITLPRPVPAVEPPTRAALSEDARWSPQLLFASSDLSTGCKLLVTNLRLRPAGALSDCRTPPAYDVDKPDVALSAGTVNARLFSALPDCSGDRERRTRQLASAALLSARFPFVSPTGQLASCLDDNKGKGDANSDADNKGKAGPTDQVYAGDGGYLENSGLHTLLALWADMRREIERSNASRKYPLIIPIAVLVDNHYRSNATTGRRPQMDELAAPFQARRRGLLEQSALEEATRAVFTSTIPGAAKGTEVGRRRWFVIAPTDRPQVAAPLGWSLSRAARASLSCQLDPRLEAATSDCPDDLPKTDGQVTLLRTILRGT